MNASNIRLKTYETYAASSQVNLININALANEKIRAIE